MGVAYIELSGTAVVQNGLVVSETWLVSKESLARLEAAMALENNKAILRRAYEQVFSEGKLEVLDEDIAPDAIDHSFPELRGVEAFKEPMAGLRTAFPDLQAKPEFIIAEGDIVMALATFTGTHQAEFLGIPATGKQITWSHVDINRIQDGKVVEAWHIGAPGAILQALGAQLTMPTE
jgi:predicted ester cyclase